MMRDVHLYGHLAKQFGKCFRFDVATAAEALRALNCAFPGRFVAALREGDYQFVRGRRLGGTTLDLSLICDFNLGIADLHIIPVPAGSKSARSAGTIKTVAGIAIIGAAIFFSGGTLAAALPGLGFTGATWGTIATIGLGMTLMGISTMLARPDSAKSADDSSFTFNGPINTNEQGNVRPLIFGEVITGGQPISVGFDIEDIPVT